MSVRTTHLSSAAASALSLGDAERIDRIRSPRWIGYTRASQILGQLESLLDGLTLPILSIQAPPVLDESRLYNAILEKLNSPFLPKERADSKQFQVVRTLSHIETRMLIIDEIHHILAAWPQQQRQVLNTIKYLGNELRVPIVAVGTRDAFHALQSDDQLANRFEPALLPRWTMGTEYLKLLASFERMLPLKEVSALVERSLALKILSMSEGVIGEISALLVRAAVRAVERGTERIDLRLLDSLNWTAPSERRWNNLGA